MPTPPTFDQFAAFLRDYLRIRTNVSITPNTLFEDDLGVTGDDGVALMEAVEKEYDISFESARELLSMKPNEYLFHSEGFGLDFLELGRRIKNLFKKTKEPKPIIWTFRVGKLYDLVYQLMSTRA